MDREGNGGGRERMRRQGSGVAGGGNNVKRMKRKGTGR